jgi:hypothetical protein
MLWGRVYNFKLLKGDVIINVDSLPLYLSRTMFLAMVEYVKSYYREYKHNPYTLYIDSDRIDFISFNKYQELLKRFNPEESTIQINMENG